MIVEIKIFNSQQDHNWEEYRQECERNNVSPQPRDNFNQFARIEYKTGFVANGKYPIYRRTKKELKQLLRLK